MKKIKCIFTLLLAISLSSCEHFLDVKPDKSLAIPTDRLENLLRLLDNNYVLNQETPFTGEVAADNLYIRPADWNALSSLTVKNVYAWERDVYNDSDRNDWSLSYNAVLYANLVLEGTEKLEPAPHQKSEWNMIRGSALFYRANAFYNLLQIYAKPYTEATAAQDPGVVLKLSPDINERVGRASVQESYDQVLADLKTAVELLPEVPAYKTRPSKPSAFALLARALLQMEHYPEALSYADRALSLHDKLLDYNLLDLNAANPIPGMNEEVIFHSTMFMLSGTYYPAGKVNPDLYALYGENDLRREVFYHEYEPGNIGFRGSYAGSILLFTGLATDELYLIRAECLARLGQAGPAMATLNVLLEKRWKAGTFTPLEATDGTQALDIILEERRKELAFRSLRWADLRRLNKDSRYAVSLTRELPEGTHTLPPGDTRYVFPLPQRVIEISGIQQN